MLRRSLSFLDRAIAANSTFALGPRFCKKGRNNVVGNIASIRFHAGRVEIEGWALSDVVFLSIAGRKILVSNRFKRTDVPTHENSTNCPGFFIDCPWAGQKMELGMMINDSLVKFKVPTPNLFHHSLNLPVALLKLGRILLENVSDVVRVISKNDETARLRMRNKLGLSGPSERALPILEPNFLASDTTSAESAAAGSVSIIIPIYNAFELLPELLRRVVAHTTVSSRLILQEDGSSDPQVRPFLRDWVATTQAENLTIELHENETNLGFIRSVNRGFGLTASDNNPVILLNSDAMVPKNWVERLIAPLAGDPDMATVTPMSNDAEIFSVPNICQRTNLAFGAVDQIDNMARKMGKDATHFEVPTGVGFCMAIAPNFLKDAPEFDVSFGRGYGEEVDWCQKVRALGGRHMGISNLFVEHRGGASFGSEEKLKLVANNNAIVAKRYPYYDAEVQDFIATDKAAVPRFILGVSWAFAQSTAPLPIYLGHTLGGGAEDSLMRQIEGDLQSSGAAIVIRVGGAYRWVLELHTLEGMSCVAIENPNVLRALFDQQGARRLVYSCGVGDPDPASIPLMLLQLIDQNRDTVEIQFHDFYPISPSYTLLDKSGHFRGVPGTDNKDHAHQSSRADGSEVLLPEWRDAWGQLVAAADKLIVFCKSSRDIVAEAFPTAREKVIVLPHTDVPSVPLISVSGAQKPNIGILGNIGFQKGAELVQRLGPALANKGSCLTIIGKVDPNYPPDGSVNVHGSYRLDELDQIAQQYGIERWLIPSIWPETFSYTTHEAIATGIPVFCFDLGGQGEAALAAENGHVLPLSMADDADALAKRLIGGIPE